MNEKKFKAIVETMEIIAKECYRRGYDAGKSGAKPEDPKRLIMSKGFRLKVRTELFRK